jgi:hypothetical protein
LQRIQRKTCLIVCEGKADKQFLSFLKSYYLDKPWVVKIDSAGGDPNSVVRRAIRTGLGYDRVFCVSDNDREITVVIPALISKSLRISPCLEAIPLQCVDLPKPVSSTEAKRVFKQYFRKDASAINQKEWPRHLSIIALNTKRISLPELDAIIKVFEEPEA